MDQPLATAIAQLEELLGLEAQQAEALERTRGEIGTSRSALARRIHDGESTGENLTDFAIANGTTPGSDFGQWHRRLVSLVNFHAAAGALVLVVTAEAQQSGNQPYAYHETLRLGVFSGDLVLPTNDLMRIALPMEDYVFHVSGKSEQTELRDGPIYIGEPGSFWCDHRAPIDKPLSQTFPEGFVPVKFDILYGDEAIRWAIQRGSDYPLTLRRMAALLSLDLDEEPMMVDFLDARRTKLIDELSAASRRLDAATLAFMHAPAGGRGKRRPNLNLAGTQLQAALQSVCELLLLAEELDLEDDRCVIAVRAKLPHQEPVARAS
jgi:hypothetical protein